MEQTPGQSSAGFTDEELEQYFGPKPTLTSSHSPENHNLFSDWNDQSQSQVENSDGMQQDSSQANIQEFDPGQVQAEANLDAQEEEVVTNYEELFETRPRSNNSELVDIWIRQNMMPCHERWLRDNRADPKGKKRTFDSLEDESEHKAVVMKRHKLAKPQTKRSVDPTFGLGSQFNDTSVRYPDIMSQFASDPYSHNITGQSSYATYGRQMWNQPLPNEATSYGSASSAYTSNATPQSTAPTSIQQSAPPTPNSSGPSNDCGYLHTATRRKPRNYQDLRRRLGMGEYFKAGNDKTLKELATEFGEARHTGLRSSAKQALMSYWDETESGLSFSTEWIKQQYLVLQKTMTPKLHRGATTKKSKIPNDIVAIKMAMARCFNEWRKEQLVDSKAAIAARIRSHDAREPLLPETAEGRAGVREDIQLLQSYHPWFAHQGP